MAMGKRAIIASLILVSLLIGLQAVEVTNANPLPPSWMNPQMTIGIQSPLPLQTMRTYGLPILLNFTAECSWEFALVNTPPASPSQDWIRAFYYVLDGQDMSSAGVNFTQIQTVTNANDSDHYFDYCGQAIVANLSNGDHNVTIYWGVLVNVGTPYQQIVFNPSWSASSQFYVDSTFPSNSPSPTPNPCPSPSASYSPTPSPEAGINASLAESASALNFGNRINFTVSVEGGNAPFTYAWYIDGELVENSTSPYYATDSQAVGSHHVYVEVKDADNNTAETLSPEFNILPSLTYMPSSSISPTQQPTTEPSQTPDRPQIGDSAPVIIPASMILFAIIVVGLLVYFGKRRGKP